MIHGDGAEGLPLSGLIAQDAMYTEMIISWYTQWINYECPFTSHKRWTHRIRIGASISDTAALWAEKRALSCISVVFFFVFTIQTTNKSTSGRFEFSIFGHNRKPLWRPSRRNDITSELVCGTIVIIVAFVSENVPSMSIENQNFYRELGY